MLMRAISALRRRFPRGVAGRNLLTAAVLLSATAAFAQTAPTAQTLSPAQIDAQWQASVAKFAPARKAELEKIAAGDAAGPFRPDWASLQAYKTPQWYSDAKFGVFVHWGVYSVPSFGSEWYSREMYEPGKADYDHHRKVYGPQDRFGYKDLIPLFTATKFDPAAWAALFKAAGARYVVPVAEHHDGFAMYASKLSDWTAVRMGPKRDVIGELEHAVRAQGLHFGVSSHRAEHDWFFDGGRSFPSDVNDPAYAALYGPAQVRLPGKDDNDLMGEFTPVSQPWLDDWLARTSELVDEYHPDLVYFDWFVGHPTYRNTVPKFLAYYYNQQAALGQGAVVNYKLGEFAPGSAVLDIERGQAPGIQAQTWQTCTSISDKSWGYVEGDTYKSPEQLIHLLIDVVSKNGNLLLNVGPRPDGTIPDAARDTLLAMGRWLQVNGAAIYGSRPWRVFGEGPTDIVSGAFQETKTKPYTDRDFRFTTHDGALYALELARPTTAEIVIHSITPHDGVARVVRLADGKALDFHQSTDGLHIAVSANPPGDYAVVYRIDPKPRGAS
jgi:alpha-L-fucosidase